MKEFPRMKSGQSTEFIPHASEQGTVFENQGITYAVTDDTDYAIPVPTDIATTISLALRFQDKIKTENYPQLEKLLSRLNCRKVAFVASGKQSIEDALDLSEDPDGLEELFEDVRKIQEEGFLPTVVEHSYSEIIEALDEYEGSFPCIVHTFEVETKSNLAKSLAELPDEKEIDLEQVKKMHRIHSFLVLGQHDDTYVCFQKMGPMKHQPFEIVTIEKVFQSYELDEDRTGYVFIGPV